MQTVAYKIEQLIRMARTGQLVVPEFQREFVWKEPQVRKLVDSVARGYPIGSILLLKHSEKADFAYRRIDATERPPDPEDESLGTSTVEEKGVYYILDGQQRLTSLVRVFANAHPRAKYYFDIRALRRLSGAEEDGEQRWFILDRARGRGAPMLRIDKWYLKTQRIFDARRVSILVDEHFDDEQSLSASERREARATVSSVFETIRNFEVPAVIMDEKSDLEAICRVFETINSTGTRLTTFDLATAKFYPQPNLRELWYAGQGQNPVFELLELDGERVLQIIALWHSRRLSQKYEPSRSNLLSLPRDVIQKYWGAAVKALRDACAWVQQRGIVSRRTLPNEATLIPLAAVLSNSFQEEQGLAPGAAFFDLLDSWYWRCCMARTFEASTNEKIATEFARLVKLLETGALDFGSSPLLLSPPIIVGIGAQRDSRARVLLSLLLSKSARDLKTGEDISSETEVESHHIFPRSKLVQHPNIDSVANRVWLLKKTNRDLGNRSPFDYLSEEVRAAHEKGTVVKLQERLSGQCIPIEPFEVFGNDPIEEAFEAFLDERARLLLNLLVTQIGPKFVEVSATAQADAADDDEVE